MSETLKLSREQVDLANRAAMTIDAIVGRLAYDEKFAKALSDDPRATLDSASLSFDKAGMESLMQLDPERYDRACEALFNLVDSEFLYRVAMPSCDPM